jgi:uncharacterized protein (TIGR03118 family)
MSTLFSIKGKTALALASAISGLCLNATASMYGGYLQVNLVSDQPGAAQFTDANLINPWGILSGSTDHLIVADNHAGVVTFYKSSGSPLSMLISVPAPDGSPGGAVTDLAINQSEHSFLVSNGMHRKGSLLVFATEDGTISGWNPDVDANDAVITVDNSGAGAIYKSLALADTSNGPRLYAANFGQGVIEIYDGAFHLVKSFTDADLASAGYVPFGLRVIGGNLFVTYAFKASPTDGDETPGPGLGYVDVFDLKGKLIKGFASQGTLNAPWGLALAPRNFGKFSGALLVGNFGDGAINAYDLKSGTFLGQLTDTQGNVIQIEGLWGLTFRSGNSSLYFTAGPNDENDGLMGVLRPVSFGSHMDN